MQAGTTEAGTAEADTTEAGTTVEEGGFQPPVKICEGHGFGLMSITLVEAPDFGPGSADFQSARKKPRPLDGLQPWRRRIQRKPPARNSHQCGSPGLSGRASMHSRVEAPDFGPGSADFQSARKKLRPLVGFSPGGAAYNAKSVQELSPTTNRG
jgi:hypothetical protein